MKSIYEGNVPTHPMSIPALMQQGWKVVDWVNTIPEIGDYIQAFEPNMGNKYSLRITGIGGKSFLAIPTCSSSFPESIYSKHECAYVFKKKGTGHCLINGIGADNEKH